MGNHLDVVAVRRLPLSVVQSHPNFNSGLPHFGHGVRSLASCTFAMWQIGQ